MPPTKVKLPTVPPEIHEKAFADIQAIIEPYRVLSVDTGTSKHTAGYCVTEGATLIEYGTLSAKDLGLKELSDQLTTIAKTHGVTHAVIEDYVYMTFKSYHTKFSDAKRANVMIGYMQARFEMMDIQCTIVSPAAWKKVLGRVFSRECDFGDTNTNSSILVQTYLLPSELTEFPSKAAASRASHWIEAYGLCLYCGLVQRTLRFDKFLQTQPVRMRARITGIRALHERTRKTVIQQKAVTRNLKKTRALLVKDIKKTKTSK